VYAPTPEALAHDSPKNPPSLSPFFSQQPTNKSGRLRRRCALICARRFLKSIASRQVTLRGIHFRSIPTLYWVATAAGTQAHSAEVPRVSPLSLQVELSQTHWFWTGAHPRTRKSQATVINESSVAGQDPPTGGFRSAACRYAALLCPRRPPPRIAVLGPSRAAWQSESTTRKSESMVSPESQARSTVSASI
jgi:hypothetical protein